MRNDERCVACGRFTSAEDERICKRCGDRLIRESDERNARLRLYMQMLDGFKTKTPDEQQQVLVELERLIDEDKPK